MPQQIKMMFTNSPVSSQLILNTNNYTNNGNEFRTILNSPMISLIHNLKPGCKSCGN